jgi:hypothetical protein
MITYTGYRLSAKQYALLDGVAEYALTRLSKRLKDSLDIEVKIVKGLLYKEGIEGDAMQVDDAASPKEFLVRLNYTGVGSFANMTSCLIHELVHVVQYAQRRLRFLSRSTEVHFEKRRYDEDMNYHDQPWEIEAHMVEQLLYEDALAALPELARYIDMKGCEYYDDSFEFLKSKIKRL